MDTTALLHRFRASLVTLAEAAGATCAVLFTPRSTGLALVAQVDVDQLAFDIANGTWTRRRDALERGEILRKGSAVLWPLFDGRDMKGLVYLNRAPEDFPDEKSREDGAVLAARLARATVPLPASSYLTTRLIDPNVTDEVLADQLALMLELQGGNISAVARRLGISRVAVYARAERFGVDIHKYRRRPRQA